MSNNNYHRSNGGNYPNGSNRNNDSGRGHGRGGGPNNPSSGNNRSNYYSRGGQNKPKEMQRAGWQDTQVPVGTRLAGNAMPEVDMSNWPINESKKSGSGWGASSSGINDNVGSSSNLQDPSNVSSLPTLDAGLLLAFSDVSSSTNKRAAENEDDQSNIQKKIKSDVSPTDVKSPDYASKLMDGGTEVFEKAMSRTSEWKISDKCGFLCTKDDMVVYRSYFLNACTHVKALKGDLKITNEEKNELVLENHKIHAERKQYTKDLSDKNLQIHEVSNKLSNKCTEMEELCSNFTNLQEKNKAVTVELNEKNVKILDMDTKLKSTMESVSEANNCSMSLASGDILNSGESNDVVYYTNRCQDLTKRLNDMQVKLRQGQLDVDKLTDEIFVLNGENFVLMNDNSKLKKEFNLKGFVHTPSGSIIPSQTLSSVTADSLYSKEKDVITHVDGCSSNSRMILQMPVNTDVSPDSIGLVTQESANDLTNPGTAGVGSNEKVGEHDSFEPLTNENIPKSGDKAEVPAFVLPNDVSNEKNANGVAGNDGLVADSSADNVSPENNPNGIEKNETLSAQSLPTMPAISIPKGDDRINCDEAVTEKDVSENGVAGEAAMPLSDANAVDGSENTNSTKMKSSIMDVIDVDAIKNNEISDGGCNGGTDETPVPYLFRNALYIGPYSVEHIRFPFGKTRDIENEYRNKMGSDWKKEHLLELVYVRNMRYVMSIGPDHEHFIHKVAFFKDTTVKKMHYFKKVLEEFDFNPNIIIPVLEWEKKENEIVDVHNADDESHSPPIYYIQNGHKDMMIYNDYVGKTLGDLHDVLADKSPTGISEFCLSPIFDPDMFCEKPNFVHDDKNVGHSDLVIAVERVMAIVGGPRETIVEYFGKKNLKFYLKKNPKPEDFKVLPTAEKNHVFRKMNPIHKHRFCFVDKSSQNIETPHRTEAFDLMVFLIEREQPTLLATFTEHFENRYGKEEWSIATEQHAAMTTLFFALCHNDKLLISIKDDIGSVSGDEVYSCLIKCI